MGRGWQRGRGPRAEAAQGWPPDAGRSRSGCPVDLVRGVFTALSCLLVGWVCVWEVWASGRTRLCPSWVLEGPWEVSRAPCRTYMSLRGRSSVWFPRWACRLSAHARSRVPGLLSSPSPVTLPAPQSGIRYPRTRGDSLSLGRRGRPLSPHPALQALEAAESSQPHLPSHRRSAGLDHSPDFCPRFTGHCLST